MIQRFLFDILKAGVADVHADPALLDTMLQDWKLPDAEMASYRDLWASRLPGVKHAYARVDDTFPLYSIVLSSEGESDLFLGNDAGTVLDEDDENYECDVQGSVWDHTYQVLCYTEHPEVTLIAYEVAKAILIPAMNTLAEDGVFRVRMSGADLMPDPRYLPSHLFARQLTFQCSRPFTVTDVDSRLTRVRTVTGIHIDRLGGRGDPGAVRTLVTPYAVEDED
jgi:hypothetical protein